MEPVTNRENILRGSVNARKTHCVAGHPFDDRNTYTGAGGRHCRACNATTARRRKDSQKPVDARYLR
jgi:hypothetical protein